MWAFEVIISQDQRVVRAGGEKVHPFFLPCIYSCSESPGAQVHGANWISGVSYVAQIPLN